MKIFLEREIRAAYAHAAAGGQAIHVCETRRYVASSAPACFRRSAQFAHFFDQNHERLLETVRRLGVRVVVVEHAGTPRQHVDLCGRPLARAIEEAHRLEAQDKAAAAQVLLPLQLP